MAWASLSLSAEDDTCLLQKRSFFRGRDTPPPSSVTLDATRNRTGHSDSAGSSAPLAPETGAVSTGLPAAPSDGAYPGDSLLRERVDPGPTDGSSVTLDSTMNGKESMSEYFNTHRESREVNRQEVLPDGVIHHTLSEKNFHETADGRTVHHHERHEVYREVRYPLDDDGGEWKGADDSFEGYGFPEEEDDDTEESGDDDEEEEEADVDSYSSDDLDYQTYYSLSPPSADQLLEEELETNDAMDASADCYYSSAVDEAATADLAESTVFDSDGVDETESTASDEDDMMATFLPGDSEP